MTPSIPKYDLIIKSALELFSHKGINETTVTELIEQTSVSRKTFYKYFDSKEDLLHELKEIGQLTDFNILVRKFVPNFDKLSPISKIEIFIEILFDKFTKKNPYENILLRVLMSPNLLKIFDIDPKEFYQSSISFIELLFKDLGISNPERKARMFLTLLDGALLDKHICEIHDLGIDFETWMEEVRIEVKDWLLNYLLKYKKK